MMASILARLEGIEERLMAIETREHRSPTPDTSATPTDGETGPLEDLIDRMKELAADLERANRAAAVLEEAHKLRRDIPTRWPEVARFLGLPKRQRTAEALMLPVSALVTRFGAPTRVRSYPAGEDWFYEDASSRDSLAFVVRDGWVSAHAVYRDGKSDRDG